VDAFFQLVILLVVINLRLSGLVSVEQILKSVHWEVIITLAFDFSVFAGRLNIADEQLQLVALVASEFLLEVIRQQVPVVSSTGKNE
jgi:hypothetical protein